LSVYNQTGTGGYRDRFETRENKLILRSFDRSEAYGEYYVTIEGVLSTEKYPFHIFTTKSDGERKFVLHPNYSIKKGCIIHYTDDGCDYLVVEQDNHSTISDFGKLQKMEDSLLWNDSYGNLHSIPYYIVKNGMGSQDNNYTIPISENRKQIWVQFNDSTKELFENQRFILGFFKPYKITVMDNFTKHGILQLTMEATQILKGDDFNSGIAVNNYTIKTDGTLGKNGVYFSYKDEVAIPKGLTKDISVYEYINDIDTGATFTFRIDGIDSNKFSIISATSNSVKIESLDFYYAGELVAIEDGSLVETKIPLILKSMI